MSTYCKSTITISHADPSVINRIADAYERKALFDEFIPCPKDSLRNESPTEIERIAQRLMRKYGVECRDTWRVLNWGTQWDTGRCRSDRVKLSRGDRAGDGVPIYSIDGQAAI